jgi:dihydropyrimidine dehydrogenase (NAD+) subunit PreA
MSDKLELNVNFAGLELRNPLIASAGPITADVQKVKRLVDAGIGAVVTKTGFIEKEYEKWIERKNIFPYKPVYKYLSLNHGTLLSQPTLADIPVEKFMRRIKDMKKLEIPIIASIMGLSIKGYIESARIMENAGADAIELDWCCNIPEFITIYKYAGENVSFNPKIYAKIVKSVKKEVSIPVGAKTTTTASSFPRIIEGLIRSKFANSMPDFVTLAGQLAQNPGIDINTLKPIFPAPALGWTGNGMENVTFAAVSLCSTSIGINNPEISAVGGIKNYENVITALILGATTVQIQTAIIDKGPSLISKLTEGLTKFLNDHGFGSIKEIIGSAVDDIVPALVFGEFWRERGLLYKVVYADVDPTLCNGCGICAQLCLEDAINVDDVAVIDIDKCRGCNLCVIKCPQNAIKLKNIGEYSKLIEKYKASEKAKEFKDFMNKKQKIGIFEILKFYRKMKKWGLA